MLSEYIWVYWRKIEVCQQIKNINFLLKILTAKQNDIIDGLLENMNVGFGQSDTFLLTPEYLIIF